MLNRLYITTKAPRVSTSPHRALLRMLKVEWGMLNSHSSSLSLAGVRRACPALKPDAADQVLLKNRAGFAAFSKGRAFHRCLEQDRCAGDREAGTGGASRRRGDALRRVAMPVAQDVSPRLIPLVVSLVPRILLGFSHYLRVSDPRAAGAPSGRDGRTGRASLQRGGMRVLSSRDAAGYARRGISLLMLLHCRFSCVRIVFSMFSLLHFGFGPRCSSRYARRWTGGRTRGASIRSGGSCTFRYGRRRGCAVRDVRGVASATASAVDVPDSSRM